MNTIEELKSRYGISIETAQSMLDEYTKCIGKTNGVMKIKDITYIGNSTREVTLECNLCGRIYKPMMKAGRNKWSELRRSCDCQKETERIKREQQKEQEKAEKERKKEEDVQQEDGKKYGDFKVIGYEKHGSQYVLRCKCMICGHEEFMSYANRKDRHCTKHFKEKFDETYIGKKNNHLTVVNLTTNADNHKSFTCRCDCGNYTVIKPTYWENGLIKSCGCLAESLKVEHTPELDRLRVIRHGMYERCYNPNSTAYKNYGGRGIKICDEWLESFDNFAEWALSHGYQNDLSIDRIDVNGNYEPDNCRWADAKTQANNVRPYMRGRKYKIGGIEYTSRQLADIYGLNFKALSYRLRKGMKPAIAMLEVKHLQDGGKYGETNR